MSTVEIDLFDESDLAKMVEIVEDIPAKMNTVAERLAEVIASTASMHYASGLTDENDNVSVSVEPYGDGYIVSANGEDVYFLEFGTGVAAGNGYDESVITPPVSTEPASWSSTKGTGEFARYGSWHHNGIKYTMTVPRMGMYFGVREAEMQFSRIVNEVFNG